jgi:eukaryotic translation initiation factor 2C
MVVLLIRSIYRSRNVRAPGTDNLRQYNLPTQFKARPGFNTTGKAVQLLLNSWPVERWPSAAVYQYDIIIGNGNEKRAVQKKVWSSQARIDKTGTQILFDGNKLAWSLKDIPEIRMMVDLDAEHGRPARIGENAGKNTFRLGIKPSKRLDLSVIQSYLEGRIQMNTAILEAISFFDHLLREYPNITDRFIPVKRSFFVRDSERMNLGGGVEVFRGVYQSMRLAEGRKLIINLDVANTTFFQPQSMVAAIIAKFGLRDVQALIGQMRPVGENGERKLSAFGKQVQSTFKKAMCRAVYQGNPAANKDWNIFKIMPFNATEHSIDWKNQQTRQVEGKVTIVQYFQRKYNLRLQYPQLPLVEMTKKGACFPMELVHIKEHQRYPFKLDDKQTANMIKFAVSPPDVRMKAIMAGKAWLDWDNDPVCNAFGLKVSNQQMKTEARLLPSPGIEFGPGTKIEQPGTRGRWDLRGKKFHTPNPGEPLSRWGIGVFPGRTTFTKPQIDKFATDFARAYRDHGGRVDNAPPHIMILPADPGQAVEALHTQTGNMKKGRPQILIFLVHDKNAFHYTRIKKSCDCRYGVVSQVMQLPQVLKGNAQYYSNVLMKVNAKLGGSTSRAVPAKGSGFKAFTKPTMIIGADVSHASPGSPQASMAALTVSWDKFGGRYAAGCQTNGQRVEMITEANFRSILGPLVTQWSSEVGNGKLPQHVFYIRDGVSEGQYQSVMQEEVPAIRLVFAQAAKNAGVAWDGELTVIIAAKRHHIRGFPQKGGPAADAKGNPVPGCLIEHDVTTPNEFDFFLYSHIALQGTSRPVHYTVLYDDANLPPNLVQNMLYEHCYQYMRSTTSVSLHPAVYYAHLASNRAKAHEDVAASQGPQAGPGFKANQQGRGSSNPEESETKPLIPMFTQYGIQFKMWYI